MDSAMRSASTAHTLQCSNQADLVEINSVCKSFLDSNTEVFLDFIAVAVQGSIPSELSCHIQLLSHRMIQIT